MLYFQFEAETQPTRLHFYTQRAEKQYRPEQQIGGVYLGFVFLSGSGFTYEIPVTAWPNSAQSGCFEHLFLLKE